MQTFTNPEPQIETHNLCSGPESNAALLNINEQQAVLQTAEITNNYKFIRGKIVLAGRQPDGDSIAFMANNSKHYNGLYRSYLLSPNKRDGSPTSVQLRFEGIDASELHYNNALQPLAKEARDFLLTQLLNFTSIQYKAATPGHIPMEVIAATPESIPVVIATNSLDPNGRPIAYLLPDTDAFEDGQTAPLETTALTQSFNYKMLESGWAYLLAYTSMPMEHFGIFKSAANNARLNKTGVWEKDTTRNFILTDRSSVDGLQAQLIYPKLFRRCIDFLNSGEPDLKEWLRKKETENDLVRITEFTTIRFSCLFHQENDRILFQADTNDIIFIEK